MIHFYTKRNNLTTSSLEETKKLPPPHPFTNDTSKKDLLHYYRRSQDLSVNETISLLVYIQETKPPKICLPLSILLTIFYVVHSHDLSSHPVR